MPDATAALPPAQDHWIDHPHGRLFARSWGAPGTGNPVVLLHDSLGCVALWREFPAQLAAATGRRVVAYDRLGFGQSDARQGRPGVDFVAQEATEYFPALRQQLGLERFVLLGHSVGGGMAVQCAARSGADCEALVTIAAQMFAEDRTLAGIRAAREQFRDPAQLQRLARYHGERAAWVLDAWIGCWLDPAFAGWTLVDVLPRVRCPVLALHGELDEYGSAVHPRLIALHCTGPVQMALLPGIGHVPHREDGDGVLRRIAAFLRTPQP